METIFANPIIQNIALAVLGTGTRIILLIVVSFVVYRIVQNIIKKLFDMRFVHLSTEQKKRMTTLHSLVHNFILIIFCFFLIMAVLSELDINATSLLAGASIIGLAIGVGAQSLVKDFVAGFFIILENQYSIGDFVTIRGISGIVTDVTLRTTKVCSLNNVVHTIPNGLIDIVSNFTKEVYVATVSIAVGQNTDPDVVLSVLREALHVIAARPDVQQGASVGGIAKMEGNSFVYEVSIPVHRSDAYGVCTAYRYEVAKRFTTARIPMTRFVIDASMLKETNLPGCQSETKKQEV